MKKILLILILISIFLNCEKIEFKQSETMAQQDLNYGSSYNDPSADTARTTFDKCQDNFDELYSGNEVLLQKTIVIPIGTWDMDTDATIDIDLASYMPNSTYRPVITAVDIIKDGLPSVFSSYPLNFVDIENSGTAVNGAWRCTDSYTLKLIRLTGGVFDGTDFNANSNRGYISLSYIPLV